MSAPSGGYAFHSKAGQLARLTNSCRTAERHLSGTGFQNAVVVSSRALEDGVPFQVVIEKKVSTWSGSIILGELEDRIETNIHASKVNQHSMQTLILIVDIWATY